eukprot:7260372-Lingulodinium_polyedra.AAC.1
MAARSLDVSQLQVIVEFPEDGNGFYWHHRVCLQRLGPGRFVMLTPDLEFTVCDLNEVAHRLVPRNGPFPPAQAPFVYAFDPMSQFEVNRHRRLAAAWRGLLGDEDDVQGEEQ